MTVADASEIIEQLVTLLEEVDAKAGSEFSGVGVIVSTNPESLPIVALRPTSNPFYDAATGTVLAHISHHWHEHHDGFHVLTPDLKIKKIAQYFSPPIVPLIIIDRKKRFGGRYLAALFGSMLPTVIATGIVSRDFGLAVFHHGDEKFYRPAIENKSKSRDDPE
ncbi:hypothetical protein G6M78_20645 [Agrobacterium tumefaciens]|uniref:hypothetical protein n=1 Tax=Agrobacterium tumefaciens TaxID=358 RepID=UPI0015726F39|nr:hypothetical protein [Agrobacterium tumefaciens]NTE57474.1 hypothetical protein [Agrobacterium tumefaciens]NTE69968.1 hypothetical protein [Agrobacterium tumefaciens]